MQIYIKYNMLHAQLKQRLREVIIIIIGLLRIKQHNEYTIHTDI